MTTKKHKLNYLIATLSAALISLSSGFSYARTSYSYFSMGSPNTNPNITSKPTSPSVVLMGGGYDVGEAFRWLIKKAGITTGSGGRFLIIRATGTDAYNPYIYSRLGTIDTTTPMSYENVGGIDLGLSSVETLIIPSRTAAADPFVLQVVGRADVIWIAGGNQADYFNYWQGTPLDTLLQSRITNDNVAIGGTSAGTAMLGKYAFVALNGSVTSTQALSDPFNKYMTIDPLNVTSKRFEVNGSFLNINYLENVITDNHLNTRDRLGRLISFMSRISTACSSINTVPWNAALGIGIDEETALMVSTDTSIPTSPYTKMELAVNPYNPENFSGTNYFPSNSTYFVSQITMDSCAAGKPLISNSGINVVRFSDPAPKAPSGTPPYTSYIATSSNFSYAYNGSINLYSTNNGAITNKAPY